MTAVSVWHISLAYLLVAAAILLFVYCLCVTAGRADDDTAEMLRREREDEARARREIYGGPGFRGR